MALPFLAPAHYVKGRARGAGHKALKTARVFGGGIFLKGRMMLRARLMQ